MSILAEPRRKQKISVDPQNLQWKNDDQKLSRKLMEKMGWNEGDGLGRNRQGDADAVKLKANYGNKGLGADKLASYDSTWIGHHDDFADILNALNKNKQQPPQNDEESAERAKKISMELSSKSLKRRIHYQKFTRAKDTSNYTDNDKSAILGIGLKRNKADSNEETDKKVKEAKDMDSTDSAPNTTVSSVSVGDYFAAKMAAFKNKQKAANLEIKKEEPEDEMEIKQEQYDEMEIKQEPEDEIVETAEEEKRRRKREKKEAKRRLLESAEMEIKQEVVEEYAAEETVEETEEERAARKAKRKEEKRLRKEAKKRAFEMDEEEIAEEATNPEEPKKKRRKIKEEDSE